MKIDQFLWRKIKMPRGGGKKRQKTDRPTSDEDEQVPKRKFLFDFNHKCVIIIFKWPPLFQAKKSKVEEDAAKTDKKGTDEAEAKDPTQMKFPISERFPGSWRVRGAIYRVRNQLCSSILNINVPPR